MKRQTLKIIVILIGGLLLLVLVNKNIRQSGVPGEVSFDAAKPAVSAKLAPAEQQPKVEYTSSSYRDPMKLPESISQDLSKAPAQRAAASYNLVLKGVSLAGDKPKAIINDQVVGIGDEIDGMKVSEITKEGVKIQMDSEEIILKIE